MARHRRIYASLFRPAAGIMPLSDQLKEETMRIGVPKEIKVHEYRVGMTPAAVREAVAHGHIVVVQAGAGAGAEYDDAQYLAVGAEIVATAEEIFARTDMIVKVKEPQPAECAMLREGQILFTYLHLAPNPEQARLLRQSGCTAIAYETVTGDGGGLPLLAPMSEVAGRMSVQVGATCLQKALGGAAYCWAACRASVPLVSQYSAEAWPVPRRHESQSAWVPRLLF
jgi:alanine dehydrogenase